MDDAMQHILDAITEGSTSPEAITALPMPETYRAVTVHKDETEMFAGMASARQGPAQVAPRRGVPAARARPRRGVRRR